MKEAEAMWALAHVQPATATEVESFLTEQKASANTAGCSKTLTQCWRHGVAIRRRRPDTQHCGEQPYEYALAPQDGESNE